MPVSTHSRLKAAGRPPAKLPGSKCRFNTQPPEGGWSCTSPNFSCALAVSTHSRLKAAGEQIFDTPSQRIVSTHSRLKAAGLVRQGRRGRRRVSTHSRLKAAGLPTGRKGFIGRRFNTQPPEGGWRVFIAAAVVHVVSTHSRLKAAGARFRAIRASKSTFQHTAA